MTDHISQNWLWWLLGAILVLGLFHRSISRVIATTGMRIAGELDHLASAARHGRRSLSSSRRGILVGASPDQPWRASFTLSALGSTFVFAFATFCEASVMSLVLETMGYGVPEVLARVRVSDLLVFAIVLPAVYCAWMFFQLASSTPSLLPNHYSRSSRLVARGAAAVVVLLAVGTVLSHAFMRADAGPSIREAAATAVITAPSSADPLARYLEPSSTEAPAPAGRLPSEVHAERITMIALGVGLLITAILSFEAGPAVLMAIAPAWALSITIFVLMLVHWMLTFQARLVRWLTSVAHTMLAFVQRIVIAALRPVVIAFRLCADWADGEWIEASGRRRVAVGLVVALCSWSRDVEIPDYPIGNRLEIDGEEITPLPEQTEAAVREQPAAISVNTDGEHRADLGSPAGGNGNGARGGSSNGFGDATAVTGADHSLAADDLRFGDDPDDLGWNPYRTNPSNNSHDPQEKRS